jgi:hypothetical protein
MTPAITSLLQVSSPDVGTRQGASGYRKLSVVSNLAALVVSAAIKIALNDEIVMVRSRPDRSTAPRRLITLCLPIIAESHHAVQSG